MADRRTWLRHATEAGANAPDLSEAFHEGFCFNSYEEYQAFLKLRPDLDPSLNAGEDLRRRWIAFGQTSVGQALRVR